MNHHRLFFGEISQFVINQGQLSGYPIDHANYQRLKVPLFIVRLNQAEIFVFIMNL